MISTVADQPAPGTLVMLKAELNRKLSADASNADERREDVLTSNVLGTVSYFPPETLLLPWFRRAVAYGRLRAALIPDDVVDAELTFWPRLGRREIDALLVLRTRHGVELVGIECKYLSGKSGEANQSFDEKQSASELRAAGDQLADYLASLRRHDVDPRRYEPREVVRTSLVYLTRHAVAPREQLDATVQAFSEPSIPADALYWLGWRELGYALELELMRSERRPDRLLMEDLHRLLRAKNLYVFTGFGGCVAPQLGPARFAFASRQQRFFSGLKPAVVPSDRQWWRTSEERR